MILKAYWMTRVDNNFSDDTKISVYNYELDAVGNRTVLKELAGTRVTWTYDDTYQLLSEHRGGPNVGTAGYRNSYTYDSAGNRTIKNADTTLTTSTFDVANQLGHSEAIAGRTTYTYDSDGSEQVVEEPSGNRTTTTWDYENLPTLYELPDATRVTLTYNAGNDRVEKETSTGTTKFVWDDANYLLETDAANVTSVVYTNEPNVFGNLISQRRNGSTNFYHFDAVGSTRELTDSTEGITDTYLFNAFGEQLTTTGSTINPFRYIGKLRYHYDIDTGNNYVIKRIYNPRKGRWYSVDTILIIVRQGSYIYVLSNPVNAVDPSGERCRNVLPINTRKCYLFCNATYFGKDETQRRKCIDVCEACRVSFPKWIKAERNMNRDWSELDGCPCSLNKLTYFCPIIPIPYWSEVVIPEGWKKDHGTAWYVAEYVETVSHVPIDGTHPGAEICIRRESSGGQLTQQCCYNDEYTLIRSGYAAGSADAAPAGTEDHWDKDVEPWLCALHLDGHPAKPGEHMCWYSEYRPINGGIKCWNWR